MLRTESTATRAFDSETQEYNYNEKRKTEEVMVFVVKSKREM